MRAGILITHAILPSFSPSLTRLFPWHSPWLALACYPTTPYVIKRPPSFPFPLPVTRSRYAVVTCRGGVNTRVRTFLSYFREYFVTTRPVLDIVRNRRVFPEVTLEEASCPRRSCYHPSSQS